MEKSKMVNQNINEEKTSIFSFFKLKKTDRINSEKPKDVKTWVIHGISEYVGTILLSLLLAGLSTIIKVSDGHIFRIEEYLIHNIIVGFYAGFIAVGLVLFIFLRWSCDLNPTVSFFRYLNGSQTGWYVVYKIFIQLLGAITAGAIIYGVGKLTNESHVGYFSNLPFDAITAAKKAFPDFQGVSNSQSALLSGSTWIFFIELVMTAVLLFPIFSPNINGKYRDLFIMFIISMSVWMGILGGSAAINPFRGLAQQLPLLVFEDLSNGTEQIKKIVGMFSSEANFDGAKLYYNSVVSATISLMLGGILAPVFYLFVQGITQRWINPFIIKVISYKNYKSEHMEKLSKTKPVNKIEQK
ncbi:aquaporin [Mycoplasmopsis felis]|uniref:aquaporin n=1 Tax=Mycoplasmopsis felis TaxID=33923 RepID=UPI002AFF7266|nr:aquaporin [Mycoplasmopsis felis]WQQ10243.1 aquaporin [Mycoplasmopsis felis]